MVRIKLVSVGRTKKEWIRQGMAHYQKLLRKYVELELVEIKEEKITKAKQTQAILDAEGERILRCVPKPGLSIALDLRGEHLSSEGFARLLEDGLSRGYGNFTFVLGGPLGLSPGVLAACPVKLSLCRMTFAHEMSRMILLEQIYRAFSIIKGTSYHK